MVARNRARYLAPLALAATIAGTYLIVHATLAAKHSTAHSHTVDGSSRTRRKFSRAKFYTVQPGDNLTIISAKTGIPVSTLEALNPNVDPNALQTLQRLRLRQ